MGDIKRPGPAALSRWYASQPEGQYTCSDCGRTDSKHYVQPQHPFYADGHEGIARCSDCIAAINQSMDERRKEQLDAMPRCEACGKHRANWTLAGVGVCGRCLKRAQAKHNRNMSGLGGLGLFMTPNYTREDVLRLARG